VLPAWLRPVALAIPATHVFEGMREVLGGGAFPAARLAAAFALNVVYLAAGSAFFAWMLGRVREKGYLARLGLE